ncbi:MAG: hypothetical protein JJU11_15030, partial [Candidatus Sumerlaeia bacterium]|nr:hypothetical protein [Candidatus Sumerlaeia bacterium]
MKILRRNLPEIRPDGDGHGSRPHYRRQADRPPYMWGTSTGRFFPLAFLPAGNFVKGTICVADFLLEEDPSRLEKVPSRS